jgi:hypothetical protein
MDTIVCDWSRHFLLVFSSPGWVSLSFCHHLASIRKLLLFQSSEEDFSLYNWPIRNKNNTSISQFFFGESKPNEDLFVDYILNIIPAKLVPISHVHLNEKIEITKVYENFKFFIGLTKT